MARVASPLVALPRQELERDVAAVSLRVRQRDPEHRERLQQAGAAERAGIAGIEAQLLGQRTDSLLRRRVVTAIKENGARIPECRVLHDIEPDAVERLNYARPPRPISHHLPGRSGQSYRKS